MCGRERCPSQDVEVRAQRNARDHAHVGDVGTIGHHAGTRNGAVCRALFHRATNCGVQSEIIGIDDDRKLLMSVWTHQKTWRPSSTVKMRSSFSEPSSTSQYKPSPTMPVNA